MRKNSIVILLAALVAMLFASCEKKYNGNMKFHTLGSTGIEVSELGVGCDMFGDVDSVGARELMDFVLDSGISYIDIYSPEPKVRANIGYALEGRRDKMNIQGHIGCYWNTALNQYEKTRDVEKCKEGFDELLRLLRTDHVEVGMMHIFDDMEDWNAVQGSPYMDYVQQLKKEGKIKHIGLSSHKADVALAAAKSGLVEVIMFSINPAFDRVVSDYSPWDTAGFKNMLPGIDPLRVELYNYCAQHDIALVVMKVFGGARGQLLDAKRTPLGVALTPTQCISYCMANPAVKVVLLGANNKEHLIQNLHYVVASDEEKDYMSVLQNAAKSQQDNGRCTYCTHCAPCPVGINIAKVNELLDKAEGKGSVPADVQKAYDELEHHAGECISCGACEKRCPFEVPIRERMAEAVRVFGK